MKHLLFVLIAAVGLSGCAGGWRNGPPAGYGGPGTAASLVPGGSPEGAPNAVLASAATPAAAAPAAAKPAAKKKSAADDGTAVTAEGVRFVWKGGGASVSVAGEFNAWNPTADPMQKQADGSFLLVKPIAPGKYPYKFVIDGNTWKEDPAAAESVDDGYGGKNSVVVVGEGGGKPAAPAVAPAPAAGAAPQAGTDGVAFTYRGNGGSVALAGEFNGWNTSADPLAKQADGSWRIVKKLEPGRYAYKFVIDGGTWQADPAATESVDDGFGGKNSVVVVGAGAAPGATAPAPAAAAPAPAGTGKAAPPRQTEAGVVFTYAGPAKTVALAGEFNAWSATADPLTRQADGSWTVAMKLPPGAYAYKFLVDGTTWKQDAANPEARDDGFGGKNSIVTVK